MNQELEELKKLVLDGDWDEDSRQSVRNLEARMLEAAAAEKSAEHPAVKPYLEYLSGRVASARDILTTKRTSAIEQEFLFAIIELATRFTSLFNGDARRATEDIIKKNLDVAKSRE